MALQFADGNKIADAIADVRNDATATTWALATHSEGNSHVLELAGSGSGDISELVSRFADNQVFYGFYRTTEKIDLSTTVKFIYVYFVGEEVPALQKGKIGTIQGEVRKLFSPFHLDFEITRASEISEELVNQKVAQNSGRSDKVREIRGDVHVQERGFTSSSSVIGGPKKSAFGFQGNTSSAAAAAVHIDQAVLDAIKDVRDDKTPTNWVVAGYANNDVKKGVVLLGKGEGGADDWSQFLTPNAIVYGLVRVVDVIEGINTVKFVFINYQGSDISIMNKAKISTHKGAITGGFGSFHVDFDISSPREISDKIILEKVQSTSGSKSKVK